MVTFANLGFVHLPSLKFVGLRARKIRRMYLSTFNSFRVIRYLSQCVSPKNRYFYHILVSPEDAPGAITLNVVWMEREFDAYKLSRCMCPSNYNRFSDRVRYWSKIVILSYPFAFNAPVRGVPVGLTVHFLHCSGCFMRQPVL